MLSRWKAQSISPWCTNVKCGKIAKQWHGKNYNLPFKLQQQTMWQTSVVIFSAHCSWKTSTKDSARNDLHHCLDIHPFTTILTERVFWYHLKELMGTYITKYYISIGTFKVTHPPSPPPPPHQHTNTLFLHPRCSQGTGIQSKGHLILQKYKRETIVNIRTAKFPLFKDHLIMKTDRY